MITYKVVDGRFFPDCDDDQFNKWNIIGYTSLKKMYNGYKIYKSWLKKIDRETLKEIYT